MAKNYHLTASLRAILGVVPRGAVALREVVAHLLDGLGELGLQNGVLQVLIEVVLRVQDLGQLVLHILVLGDAGELEAGFEQLLGVNNELLMQVQMLLLLKRISHLERVLKMLAILSL